MSLTCHRPNHFIINTLTNTCINRYTCVYVCNSLIAYCHLRMSRKTTFFEWHQNCFILWLQKNWLKITVNPWFKNKGLSVFIAVPVTCYVLLLIISCCSRSFLVKFVIVVACDLQYYKNKIYATYYDIDE